MTMIAPLSRILARYLSGTLVTYGVFAAPDAAMLEPEIVMIVGAAIGAIAEGAYAIAVRKGWSR
jgi:hypothetical protein